MGFYLQRYRRAWSIHRRFSLLVPLVLALYLVLAALFDTTFVVTKELTSYSADIPVSEASRPVGAQRLGDLVADPALLFIDRFALMELREQLELSEGLADFEGPEEIRRIVATTLSLMVTGDLRLLIGYTGKDLHLGQFLISFYSDRLMRRIAEGISRVPAEESRSPAELQPSDRISVVRDRSLWSSDRLVPAVIVVLVSLISLMVLIGVLESLDPSFKSDRQIAHYLNMPVLGSIPDAEPLAGILAPKEKDGVARR